MDNHTSELVRQAREAGKRAGEAVASITAVAASSTTTTTPRVFQEPMQTQQEIEDRKGNGTVVVEGASYCSIEPSVVASEKQQETFHDSTTITPLTSVISYETDGKGNSAPAATTDVLDCALPPSPPSSSKFPPAPTYVSTASSRTPSSALPSQGEQVAPTHAATPSHSSHVSNMKSTSLQQSSSSVRTAPAAAAAAAPAAAAARPSSSVHVAVSVQRKLRNFLAKVHRELSDKPSELQLFTQLLNTR